MNTPPRHCILVRVLAFAVALAALVAGQAEAGRPHVRDGWQFGVGYGYSSGRITFSTEASDTGEGGATPQVRFGRMLGRHLALGVEYNGWMVEGGLTELKLRSSLQQILLAATWYPGRPDEPLGGLYVRAGAGLGWGSIAAVAIEEQEQIGGIRLDDSGLGLLAALGYEFRVADRLAVGMGVGLNYLSLHGLVYETGWYTPVTGTLCWYWD